MSTCEIALPTRISALAGSTAQPTASRAPTYERSRVVFTKHGREDDTRPCPMQAARRIKRASTVQNEHAAAAGLLGRVILIKSR